MTTSIFPHVSLRFHPGYFNKQSYLALPSTVCQHLYNSEIWTIPSCIFRISLGRANRSSRKVISCCFMVCISPPNTELPISPLGCFGGHSNELHHSCTVIFINLMEVWYWNQRVGVTDCLVVFEVGWWLVRSNDGSCHRFRNRRTKLCEEKSWWGWVLMFSSRSSRVLTKAAGVLFIWMFQSVTISIRLAWS